MKPQSFVGVNFFFLTEKIETFSFYMCQGKVYVCPNNLVEE